MLSFPAAFSGSRTTTNQYDTVMQCALYLFSSAFCQTACDICHMFLYTRKPHVLRITCHFRRGPRLCTYRGIMKQGYSIALGILTCGWTEMTALLMRHDTGMAIGPVSLNSGMLLFISSFACTAQHNSIISLTHTFAVRQVAARLQPLSRYVLGSV